MMLQRYLLYLFFLILAISTVVEVDAAEPPRPSVYEHPTGSAKLVWEYEGSYDYFVVYESIDAINYERIGTTTGLSYTRYGLTNGVTYYYRLSVVVEGVEYGPGQFNRVTPPYTVMIVNQPLIVVDYASNAVQLDWGALDSGSVGGILYVNGQAWTEVPPGVTSDTVTGLDPGVMYEFWFVSSKGIQSNKVRVRTKDYDHFFSRFEDSMRSLFVPDPNVDGNGNGIPDWQEPLINLEGLIKNWGPIKVVVEIRQILDQGSSGYTGRGDDLIGGQLPGPPRPGGSGIPIVIDPNTGQTIIEMPSLLDGYNQMPDWLKEIFEWIRTILTWILWISFFIYVFARWMPRATL